MYHYVESVTNTRGDALPGFFVKAVDTATGEVADIYADENLTPIVTESGLANAAEVQSNGRVSFYIEDGDYDLYIYATDGTTQVDVISDVPMTNPGDYLTASSLADTGGAAMVGVSDGRTVQDVLDGLESTVGYSGGGGTATQITSKSTAVTINAMCGQITTHDASLASGAVVFFFLNNENIDANDLVIVQLATAGGGAHGIVEYRVQAGQPESGRCGITIKNESGGALAEALVLNFAIIKNTVSA